MSVTVEAFHAAFSESADVPNAAGRARSERLTVVESRRINTYVSIGNTNSVVREGVQAAADWCLPHARGKASKEAGGRLFNARLFHAGGTFPFPSPTARQCLVCSTRVGNVCMCSMPSFVRGGW